MDMNRLTITNRGDCDNSSDPAASSSSGSNNDDPAATPDSPIQRSNPSNPSGPNSNRRRSPITNQRNPTNQMSPTNQRNTNQSDNSGRAESGPSEAQRIDELRIILPDSSIEDLRAILRENDRASTNSRQSAADAEMARASTAASRAVPEEPAGPSTPGSDRPSLSRSSRGSSRRSWQPCQPAPSRPGIFRVGGPIETGGTYNIGVTDEMELEIKRIEAVSQVQDSLNDKLGYDLRESGKYEEMEREYKEGERMLASTGLERREKKILPPMMMWEAPPVSQQSMMKKEPNLPEPGEPLPLPLSFGGHEEGMQNGGNGEICLGKFVDPGPDRDEDEQKREETSIGDGSWGGISVDSSPMGPYEHVVRCWKCRAGLKVHIEVGLVACPRCRTISPATEMANIG